MFLADLGTPRVNTTTGVEGTHPNEERCTKKPQLLVFSVKLKEWGKGMVMEKVARKVEGLGWGARFVCKMELLTGGAQRMPVNHRVKCLMRGIGTSA